LKLMLESAHEIVENDPMFRVPRSRWARSKLAKAKIRTYRFYGVTPPEPSTSLKIEFYISRYLSGHVHTRLSFYLRPYLYLLPDRAPFPDHFVTPPFRLSFFGGSGAGTEASPTFLGGIFKLSACTLHGCDGMALLEIDQTRDVMACVAVISSGEPITFTLIDEEGGMSIKLRLQLTNDQERRFQQLYGDLMNAVWENDTIGKAPTTDAIAAELSVPERVRLARAIMTETTLICGFPACTVPGCAVTSPLIASVQHSACERQHRQIVGPEIGAQQRLKMACYRTARWLPWMPPLGIRVNWPLAAGGLPDRVFPTHVGLKRLTCSRRKRRRGRGWYDGWAARSSVNMMFARNTMVIAG
jgi:hypothetical protein